MARLRRLIVAVLALTHLGLGGLASQSVLCIEPGGRIAIECAGALCCDSRDCDDDVDVPDRATLASAGCCPCVDIALPGDFARSAVREAKLAKLELTSFVAMLPSRELAATLDLLVIDRGERERDVHGPPPRTFAFLRC